MDKLGPLRRTYSGQVVGAVVEALGLDQGVLRGRTARRFFDGRPVNDYSRKEILEGLAEALVDRGIVPVPHLFREYDVSMVSVIGGAVARAALQWDNLIATIQSRSTIEDSTLAIKQFLSLVVVDLSLRIFALLRMAGLKPHPPGTPLWAEENGGRKLLRRLTERAGLTREKLASRLNVSDTAVDNWLDGKNRPTPGNIAAIADALASHSEDATPDQLEIDIHRQFTFAHIADLLVPWIGRESVIELSTALVRFIWLITEDVQGMNRRPIEEAAGAEFTALRFGTAHTLSHTLLRNLALAESDANWRMIILAATHDWSMTFEMIAARSAGSRFAAGLAQDVLDVSASASSQGEADTSDTPFDPAVEALQQAAEQVYQGLVQGDIESPAGILNDGIALRRSIVRDFPLSPRAHLELGSFLGIAGKNLGRRDLIDEGVIECKISAALLPGWDNPAVEPGIILANIGDFEAALCELKRARENLCEATPHLQFIMGWVLMNLSRYTEALEQLEEVVGVRPNHALAFLHASRCAFKLGDNAKGVRYAKTARHLGEPDEYIAWKVAGTPLAAGKELEPSADERERGGLTPIPASSAGQALAFPHQGGREFANGQAGKAGRWAVRVMVACC